MMRGGQCVRPSVTKRPETPPIQVGMAYPKIVDNDRSDIGPLGWRLASTQSADGENSLGPPDREPSARGSAEVGTQKRLRVVRMHGAARNVGLGGPVALCASFSVLLMTWHAICLHHGCWCRIRALSTSYGCTDHRRFRCVGMSPMAEVLTLREGRADDLAPEAQALLAARVYEGDCSAEEEVARLFHRRVLMMTLSRVRNAETARDLTQEVLLAVVLALRKGQVRDTGKLAAFIHGTARNVVNGFFRSRPPESVPLSPEHAIAGADDILDNLHQTSLMTRLLDSVDAADRRILSLTLLEGLKPGEIAERLGLSSEVVRARKSRAIKRAMVCMRGTASQSSGLSLAEE
jgi:RNA polymerase sigma factor (sigma-70 family)